MTWTWLEAMKTMDEAYQQHQNGEHPIIIPEHAEVVNGVYRWEGNDMLWSWRPVGTNAFSMEQRHSRF